MITVESIVTPCRSLLDAEGAGGSGRYDWERDFLPTIKLAQKWVVMAINAAMGQKKYAGETLRDLTRTRVWSPSQYSRIMYDSADTGHNLWSILAVHPKATIVLPTGDSLPTTTTNSEYVGTASFIESRYQAERVSREVYNNRFNNTMLAGSSDIINEDLIRYAYISFDDYVGMYTYPGSVKAEIEVSPSTHGEAVAISYLKVPVEPVDTNEVDFLASELEWPETIHPLMVERTLLYISHKRDSKPNDVGLFQISSAEIANVIQMLK